MGIAFFKRTAGGFGVVLERVELRFEGGVRETWTPERRDRPSAVYITRDASRDGIFSFRRSPPWSSIRFHKLFVSRSCRGWDSEPMMKGCVRGRSLFSEGWVPRGLRREVGALGGVIRFGQLRPRAFLYVPAREPGPVPIGVIWWVEGSRKSKRGRAFWGRKWVGSAAWDRGVRDGASWIPVV